jgi:hypothetical protein
MPPGGHSNWRNVFWYLLDYTCSKGEWSYAVHSDFELFVNNPDGFKSSIKQEEVLTSKKRLSVYTLLPQVATRAIWSTFTAN